MFIIREKCKSKHKFGGTKVSKAEYVRKYFVNPQIETEVFGWYVNYIICSLDVRNTEAVIAEQVFLKISQCSQEHTSVGVSF